MATKKGKRFTARLRKVQGDVDALHAALAELGPADLSDNEAQAIEGRADDLRRLAAALQMKIKSGWHRRVPALPVETHNLASALIPDDFLFDSSQTLKPHERPRIIKAIAADRAVAAEATSGMSQTERAMHTLDTLLVMLLEADFAPVDASKMMIEAGYTEKQANPKSVNARAARLRARGAQLPVSKKARYRERPVSRR